MRGVVAGVIGASLSLLGGACAVVDGLGDDYETAASATPDDGGGGTSDSGRDATVGSGDDGGAGDGGAEGGAADGCGPPGTLDPTFVNGFIDASLPATAAVGVAVDDAGVVWIGADQAAGASHNVALVRLQANGAFLDNSASPYTSAGQTDFALSHGVAALVGTGSGNASAFTYLTAGTWSQGTLESPPSRIVPTTGPDGFAFSLNDATNQQLGADTLTLAGGNATLTDFDASTFRDSYQTASPPFALALLHDVLFVSGVADIGDAVVLETVQFHANGNMNTTSTDVAGLQWRVVDLLPLPGGTSALVVASNGPSVGVAVHTVETSDTSAPLPTMTLPAGLLPARAILDDRGGVLVIGSDPNGLAEVARLDMDAGLDTTYAEGGVARVSPSPTTALVVTGVSRDPQGRIVFVANTGDTSFTNGANPPRPFVARICP